jgi:hypothetical protein
VRIDFGTLGTAIELEYQRGSSSQTLKDVEMNASIRARWQLLFCRSSCSLYGSAGCLSKYRKLLDAGSADCLLSSEAPR